MKAWRVHELGEPAEVLSLGEVPIPEPGPGQVRIRITTAALNWSDDLGAGINKLSLPLVASGEGGGQMVVRLSHPDSEQLFVIDLPLDS